MQIPFYYLYDEDDYKAFIKAVMKQFRTSNEYLIWLNATEREICAATGMTKSDDGIQIEVHHYGKTLWDWVEYIMTKFYDEDLPFNSFYICLILNTLHFSNCISYVPLTHCIHKMLHHDYYATLEKYPHIVEYVHPENMLLTDIIINDYIKNLKILLHKEEVETHEQI